MTRYNYGWPPEGHGPYPYEGQGVHHHYHYYGETAGRRRGPTPTPPGEPPSFFGPANLHRHPGADSLVKGLLIGAGVAYLLTNERAQRALLKTSVQLWTAAQNSVEEWKERFRDAEAEAVAAAVEASEEKGSSAD